MLRPLKRVTGTSPIGFLPVERSPIGEIPEDLLAKVQWNFPIDEDWNSL